MKFQIDVEVQLARTPLSRFDWIIAALAVIAMGVIFVHTASAALAAVCVACGALIVGVYGWLHYRSRR